MRVFVGTDLVSLTRFGRTVEHLGDAFLERTFTEAERDSCGGDLQRLAARWAAKESLLKALGAGLDQIALPEIEVTQSATGAPQIVLRGAARRAASAAGWAQCAVSLAHDGDYATATVVAWAPDRD